MLVKSEDYSGVCVVSLTGDLAGEMVAAAKKSADEATEHRQIADLVIDFEKAGSVDSEGLEMLLKLKRRCEDMFGQFKLAGMDANVRKILQITRLDHQFQIAADVPTALKTMR